MNYQANDVAAMLVDSATAFIDKAYQSRPPRFQIEEPQRLDRPLWAEMARLGWLGVALPESLGGLGMGMHEAASLAQVLGRKAVAEPYTAAAVLPGLLLSYCDAASPLVQDLAEAAISGEKLFTVAWQETAGSSLGAQAPSTRLDSGELTGVKSFVPALEDDSLMLVTASAGEELVVLAVAADAQGVSWQRRAGGLMSYSTVSFDAVVVPAANILLRGADSVRALKAMLEGGRVAIAAQLSGIAAGALEKTVTYVNQRVQFERPIGSFQTIQHRCVDGNIAVMLADASWRNAQRLFDLDPLGLATEAAVSAAKARGADAAMQVCRAAVQMHGAMGFTEEAGVGAYLRAAMQLSGWLGNSTSHRRRFLAAQGDHSL